YDDEKTRQNANDAAVPEQEAARMAALKRLRHKLVTQCAKMQHQHNAKPPTLAMERWLSRESLQREISTEESNLRINDPILPSSGIVDDGLVKDLSRNMEYEQAQTIAEMLAADAKTAAERILLSSSNRKNEKNSKNGNHPTKEYAKESKAQLKECTKAVKKASKAVQKNLNKAGDADDAEDAEDADDADNTAAGAGTSSSSSIQTSLTALHQATQQLDGCIQRIQRIQDYASNKNTIVLNNSRRPGICDVMLLQADGTFQKPYLTISMSHLIKFVQLWQFQQKKHHSSAYVSPKSVSQNPSSAIHKMSDGSSFLRNLYCCLSRYEMIKGAGYQCAMPPVAFDAAHTSLGLGTTIECFASPFNCRYKQYCSAFPDLETKFGSLGSFFDDGSFFPTNGSFEANPPFVPEIMWAMNGKLQRILENPKAKALSFLVIVPIWGASGIGYVGELESSEFCVAKSRVLAADHSFCDGAQHKALKQELRPSSWDTAVILLQNKEGQTTWPVSQTKLDRVFCAALKKSKTKSSLADWERRGVGKGGSAATVHKGHKRPYSSHASSSASPPNSNFPGKKTRF
ncbi:MAG: hypothetical protein SGBAC_010281, partial [Bacillariaceae sp.]